MLNSYNYLKGNQISKMNHKEGLNLLSYIFIFKKATKPLWKCPVTSMLGIKCWPFETLNKKRNLYFCYNQSI